MSDKKLNTELNGIAPSLHTPFNNDKTIDYLSLKRLLDHTIETKCSGMLVGAVAGETQSLSFDEKIELMDFVLSYVENRIPVIIGCSASNQKERIRFAKAAKSKGAEWFLVQSPEGINGKQLVESFNEISSFGPKNLMIQDLSWHDNGLSDNDILSLYSKVDKFNALKIEVVNSGPKYSRIKKITNNTLHLSGGWAVSGLIEAIHRGVHSFIPSTMEIIFNDVYNLAINQKIDKARALFNLIIPIISFTHQHIDISIKFAKMLRVKEGIFDTNVCRGEISDFDEYQLKEVNILLEKIISIQDKYKD